MGKTDKILYDYLSDKDRFSDLFNGCCFEGRQIIRPNDLELLDGRYSRQRGDRANISLIGDSAGVQERDLLMLCRDQAFLRLLAVENQTQIDYTMPWRCMNYDVREYEKQIRQLSRNNRKNKSLQGNAEFLCGLKKEDRLIPVYTLCVYYGEETWDGPRSLRDMMCFGALACESDHWFRDYGMNLICANEWEDSDRFLTSLRQVFGALPYRKNKEKLRRVMQEDSTYRHLDGETYKVLALLLGQKELAIQSEKEEKEEWDMCKALEDIRMEGFEEGIERGIERGMERGVDQGKLDKTRTVVRNMLQRGMTKEDIIALAECSGELVEDVKRSIKG